jgi:ABC-2 type transport system permease protein
MINQIRSEWVKLRSVRSTMAMLVAAVVLAVGIGLLTVKLSKNPDIVSVLTGVSVANLLFMVLGVQIIGQEYRFNTIRPTFSTAPKRGRVIAAKAVVLTTAVAATTALLVGLTLAGAQIVAELGDRSIDVGPARRIIIGTIVAAVLSSLFGYAIGCLVRQPIAGMMIALIWVLAVELTISALLDGAERWLPIASVSNLTTLQLDNSLFSPVAGALYSLAICAALCAAGSALIRWSDA